MTHGKHECARCGQKQTADRMIFSRTTRLRFCRDFAACDRRYARKVRREAASEVTA